MLSSDLNHFKSGTQDIEIIKSINESTEPVSFFTGNIKDFKNKLNRNHQLIGVSRKLPKDKTDKCVIKAKRFLEKKTGTKKHPYLLLTSDYNKNLVLEAKPGTKEAQIFKICDLKNIDRK